MKRFLLMLMTIILMTLVACNTSTPEAVTSMDVTESGENKEETSKPGEESSQDQPEEEGSETTPASGEPKSESKTSEKGSSDEFSEQMGEPMPSIDIGIDLSTNTFGMNGVFTGDSNNQVIQTLGEPIEKMDNERYDYTFIDAWYSEKLMVVFDDLGVNYLQADSSMEDGKLLSDSFINDFPGTIYQATEEQKSLTGSLELLVFVLGESSVLAMEKYEDESTDVTRSYMVSDIHHWSFARGWDMAAFQDETQFNEIDALTALSAQ
ncbi:hypothetical protein LCL89_12305 [Halobacillus yeomjeoni]|uniref:hypothetical protein n=1 Tax=Halobacillus yeomjeoni TaxID=311194 RepID=UPI001CD70794|nr:hypothetical protein [Halobacillus yeomjeoni]MCA0984831.1 hypothetical protein [Halobacillus yeomjeoni]